MSARQPTLFSKTARKWTLWVHVLSSSLWLGSALAMMILTFAKGRSPTNAAELHAFCLCVKLIDDFVIIASCGVSALSGILLSWKTPWGFFRYWWVAVKLCITVALLCVGAGLLGPWINETEALARTHGWAARELPRYQTVEREVTVLGSVQLVILGFVLYASIFKPWGKTSSPGC
ncbi:DUF2269 family protein [Enhygromyxa salina]|nr:DUF2269 family protein [Enhygromyxa salina]